MEVRDVEAIPLSYDLGEGRTLGSSRGQTGTRFATLVRLETADGTVGWGEALAPPRTVATYVEEQLADRVRGTDPVDVESLPDYHYITAGEVGGDIALCGLSAVETALWDLKGKQFGYPVGRLLGGRTREELVPYASTLYVTSWDRDIAEPLREARDEGFTAAKIKIGRGVEDDVERVRTAREVLGEDAHLMVDFNGNYTPKQAIASARAIAEYDLTWIEEPVPPENLEGYRQVDRHVDVPLAAGEAHYGRFEYDRLLDVVDVVQPDLARCGGFAEARLLARMATTRNVAVHPHVWNSGVGVAAAVQFAASLSDYPALDNAPEPRFLEFDRSENPLREEVLAEPFDPTGGSLAVPDGPGLGIEVDEDAVARYRVER